MARRGIFQGLRRRGAVLCAVFSYALLLNVLLAAAFNVQAIAAAIDPLAAAPTCDGTGSSSSGDPARHNEKHQPDCMLCSPACPMGGSMLALAGAAGIMSAAPSSFGLDAGGHPALGVKPPSVYLSDTAAQAPPAIG